MLRVIMSLIYLSNTVVFRDIPIISAIMSCYIFLTRQDYLKLQDYVKLIIIMLHILCDFLVHLHGELRRLSHAMKRTSSSATLTDDAVSGTDINEPSSSTSSAENPVKRPRTTLFANYNNRGALKSPEACLESQLTKYLEVINGSDFSRDICISSEYKCLRPLFSNFFSVPATSAPVERVFSQSGLIMKPHRAKMGDNLLESLVYLKCN